MKSAARLLVCALLSGAAGMALSWWMRGPDQGRAAAVRRNAMPISPGHRTGAGSPVVLTKGGAGEGAEGRVRESDDWCGPLLSPESDEFPVSYRPGTRRQWPVVCRSETGCPIRRQPALFPGPVFSEYRRKSAAMRQIASSRLGVTGHWRRQRVQCSSQPSTAPVAAKATIEIAAEAQRSRDGKANPSPAAQHCSRAALRQVAFNPSRSDGPRAGGGG